jgi:hypothetical protein
MQVTTRALKDTMAVSAQLIADSRELIARANAL